KEAQEQDIYKSIIDIGIAQKGVDILDKEFHLGNFKFMHGHFWYGDMIMPSKKEVVLFSNLLWSWRYPFYDITFSYHWHMLGMEHVENLTEDLMKKEREKWWNRYFNLANVKNNKSNQRLIKIALLERALAGILVDKFHLDFSKPQSEIVIRDRMKEVKKLIQSL
ncbi:MAG TPA: hypothetical protein VK338_05915, partial [Candidatus Nitrosocosmicus sp.]|nr:hypothetical protein [Candidatus Nitrosocosmicus sp.]